MRCAGAAQRLPRSRTAMREKPQVAAIALERIAREAVFEPERSQNSSSSPRSSASVGAWIFVMQQPALDVDCKHLCGRS